MNGRLELIALLFITVILLMPAVMATQSQRTYSVTITESGLPGGTEWSITVNGAKLSSNNSTIAFLAQNGTYDIAVVELSGYSPRPASFAAVIAGHNLSYDVLFGPPLYSVVFVESGLPSGTAWNVTVGNETESSINSKITFQVVNGTYNYLVPGVNGTLTSVQNGTVTVSGSNVEIPLIFSVAVQYTFIEQGLPSGSHWSVVINGTYFNSSSSLVTVTLGNGTYDYVIAFPHGYTPTPAKGRVGWNNSVVIINASSPLVHEIAFSVIAVLVALLVIFYYRKSRRKKPELIENDKSKKEE